MYVATTRAVYEFYGLITAPADCKEDKRSLIDVFVPEENRVLGTQLGYHNETDIMQQSSTDMRIVATQPDDITDLICDSATEIYGGKNKDILLKGLIVHYALSLIENFDEDSLAGVINKAVKETELIYPDQDTSSLKKILKKLLSIPDIAVFFDKENKIYNEKEFVDRFGNTVRLDKLVIKDNEIDIVDYKTSIYDKEYIQKQMDNYRSVIKEIYPDKPIKCYIIEIEKNTVHLF